MRAAEAQRPQRTIVDSGDGAFGRRISTRQPRLNRKPWWASFVTLMFAESSFCFSAPPRQVMAGCEFRQKAVAFSTAQPYNSRPARERAISSVG